jgi:hypothetical protein
MNAPFNESTKLLTIEVGGCFGELFFQLFDDPGCYQWTLNGPGRYPESVSIFDLTLYGSFIPTVSASYGTFNDASMSHMARSGDEA